MDSERQPCLSIAASPPRSCKVSSASQPATCLLPTSSPLPSVCKTKERSSAAPRWAIVGATDPAEPEGARGAGGCQGKGALTASALPSKASLCPALLPGQAAHCQEPDGRIRHVPTRPAALLRVSMEGSAQLWFWCRIAAPSPRQRGPGTPRGAQDSAWEKSITKSAL